MSVPPVNAAATLDPMSPARDRQGNEDQSAPEGVRCDHCGLPVPTGLIEPEREHQFCCNGCETVFRVLRGSGLEGYYGIRDAVDSKPQPPEGSGSSYEEFDDPAFQAACVRNQPGGLCETELLLTGMHCAACVWLIERLPRVCPGVLESRANIRTRSAVVRYAPDQVKLSAVARAIDKLGYSAHPARGSDAREARAREDRKFLIRVGVAGAIAGNVMLLAIALYAGALGGIEPFWEHTLRYYSMGLGLLALVWPGRVFFVGALAALRTRTAHLDIPVALALLAGGVWGTINTLRGTGEIYFDSLAVLVFLLLVGRWVQHRQQRSAADQVELMLTLTPSSATLVLDDQREKRVPIESIETGMLVRVEAGGSIPVDGVIESGQTQIDNALLTGESRPVASGIGDQVIAGATNLAAPITVRVNAVGESTRAAKLMALVANASTEKAPIVQFADRVAARFVVVVILLALLTFGFWTSRAGLHTGIEYATALLIVTCPCALGLATPMAMSIAMGRAARKGILIKSAAAIEQMAKPDQTPGQIVLDKTGTLTQGTTRLVESDCDRETLRRAGALESASNHPIARAIVESQSDDPDPLGEYKVEQIVQHTGRGIEGIVNDRRVIVGSPEMISEIIPIDTDTQRRIDQILARSLTPVVVSDEGGQLGVLGIGDPLRQEARLAVETLRSHGWTLTLCSGDHPQIARSIADEVGIEHAIGSASPEEKARLVRTLRQSTGGRVVMVGDGVNDSAALAGADVGIAVHGGAEASLQAADVYFTSPGLSPLLTLVSISSHTMRTIHVGLAFSLFYNVIAAGLAMSGIINALIAAVLMPISSLSVVTLATRPHRERHPCPSSSS